MSEDETVDAFAPLIDADITAQSFTDQLVAFAKQTGRELKVDAANVGAYAAERAAHLSGLVSDPGFEDAVLAERDNVLIKAGIAATKRGDIVDERLVGIIQGALRTAAVMLAA